MRSADLNSCRCVGDNMYLSCVNNHVCLTSALTLPARRVAFKVFAFSFEHSDSNF